MKRASPDDYTLPGQPILGVESKFGDPRRSAEV